MPVVKKPSESSTILAAVVGLAVVVIEAILSRYVLSEPILDGGTRVTIVIGALAMVGFRFKTDSAVKFVWFIPLLLLLTAGCASTQSMYEKNMEERVDNLKVIDIGRDNRGLVFRIPRPTDTGAALIEIILGWSREYVGIAGIPVDENDTGRYMRGSNVSADASISDDALGGKMDDVLLIEVISGPASEEVVEEEVEEEVIE